MGQQGNATFSAQELAAREIRLRKADEWPQFVKPCSHRCMNCETCGADVFVYEHRLRTALKEALDGWEKMDRFVAESSDVARDERIV